MKKTKLFCTKCNKEYTSNGVMYRCQSCNEPLEVELVNSGNINTSINPLNQSIFERYKSFYPYFEIDNIRTLGEGFTPLLKMNFDDIDIDNIYIKNETVNPTWSFKDRGTSSGIIHAIEMGCKKIGTVSSGNMAVSIAAFGGNAGMDTVVLVNQELSKEKINPILMYGARLIKVEGDYSKLYFESLKIGEKEGRYFINSDAPFRIEGYKTLAFEVYEQLNRDVPDFIAIPTSAGGHLRGVEKGFRELKASGIVNKIPRIIACQPVGCHPIVKAMDNCDENIIKFKKTPTIAHATENAIPPSGNQVLRILKKSNGLAVKISDENIIYTQNQLARKGIFVQPASAMSLAGVRILRNTGEIKSTDKVVCIVTGSGLKYTKAFEMHDLNSYNCKLEELDDYLINKKSK